MNAKGLQLLLLCTILACASTDDRTWDWVSLGDPGQSCLQPGDWVEVRHNLDWRTGERVSIQQVSAATNIWLEGLKDSVHVGTWRMGDVLRHRQNQGQIEIIQHSRSAAEVTAGLVQRGGWSQFASALNVNLDTTVGGCFVSWQQPQEKVSWGTEVEVEVSLASLVDNRAVGEWQRQDFWRFPFGASDQLIPPLDTIMSLQRGGYEAWCLASLGHRAFLNRQDTAVAFRVTWHPLAAP